MTKTIEEVLATLPKDWHWEISCPPQGFKGKLPYINENGKEKWRDAPYTAYVQNGKLFATPFYASVHVDGDNIVDCLLQAIVKVKAKEDELREEAKKAPKGKRR